VIVIVLVQRELDKSSFNLSYCPIPVNRVF